MISEIERIERNVANLTNDPDALKTRDAFLTLESLQRAVAGLTRTERIERVQRLLVASHRLLTDAVVWAQTDIGMRGQPREVTGVVTLVSGGNDSTTLAHIFRDRASHIGMANTQVGIEPTRQYVRNLAASWGLPIVEKFPFPREGYEDLVLGRVVARTGPNKGKSAYPGGFPGPAMHSTMFTRLKERAFEQIRNELVSNPLRERVVFIAGRRATESNRRKSLAFKSAIERKGSIVWCAPLINWTKMDLNAYRLWREDVGDPVPRNEVSDRIHMSGECLCGAFAHENELAEVGEHYPSMRAYLEDLERRVADENPPGVRKNPACVKWGWGWDKGESFNADACECKVA